MPESPTQRASKKLKRTTLEGSQSKPPQKSPLYSSPITTPPPPSWGGLVCRWIETNLVHGEGDKFGEPFRLEPWQRAFIWRLYEYDAKTNRRIVRRALLGTPKGNGKTELLAAIALAELAGPRAPIAANIPVAAASFEQADLLFGTARIMLTQGPLAPHFEVFDTEILRKDGPGRMYRVAAAAGTNDGGRPTCFIADELHEWTGNKERVHLVLSNSLAKRAEALELNISTAGSDENSLLGRLLAYAKKINLGEVTDPSFLAEWWQASEDHNIETEDGLRAALEQANPSAPAFVDIERLMARFIEIPRHEFERYHLNRFVQPPDRWIGLEQWMKLKDVSLAPQPGAKIAVGFDGSYARDASSLVGCTLDGYIFHIKTWERNTRDPEWTVPRSEVDAAVDHLMQTYDATLFCDPPGWQTEIEEWGRRYGNKVAIFSTATLERMGPACDRFFTAVATGEGLRHDGDPLLARHIGNVHTKTTRYGTVIGKAYKSSPDKIDAAVAAVVSFQGVKSLMVEAKPKPKVEWVEL